MRVSRTFSRTPTRTLVTSLALSAIVASGFTSAESQAQSRSVHISNRVFMDAKTEEEIVLSGPNIVVKAPPYLPSVEGDTICNDAVDDTCMALGNCTTCYTFNQADVDHIKAVGWNFIRLGVVWAGAQPKDEDALDPTFLERLHAILNLTDVNGLHVMLDNHGDMVGSQGCGNGVPTWVQQKAASHLIGKPLETRFPYSVVMDIKDVDGYDHCGDDEEKWAQYAGDPNYNLLNECCLAMNSPNPGELGFTTMSQQTMDYVLLEGDGREEFVRFWTLIAEAVKEHPSAFAFELMNEPMSIRRTAMFDTWVQCAKAITAVIPDAAVSVADVGEGSVLPAWLTSVTGGDEFISDSAMEYISSSGSVFYAWHYGSAPKSIDNMQEVSESWGIPTFATEVDCTMFDAAAEANISHSYWHYSCYCDTGPWFGNKTVPTETFGGCMLGWGAGNSSKCL